MAENEDRDEFGSNIEFFELEDSEPSSEISGRILGDFRLIRQIGRGGMAVVFESEQISLKRKVALKVLPTHLSISHESVQKFYREAEAGGRQKHAGIVAVYAVGEHDSIHYIAQELVEGGYTLADGLEEVRDLPELPRGYFRKTAQIFYEVADALHHAHSMGVIHRDVKPSNILITQEGKPKISDFGLAKIEDALSLSRSGDFVGTPYYMSPEQAVSRGFEIDHRTDVYSLGVTLYESLALKRPFEGKTTHDVLKKIIFSEPAMPSRLNPRVPRDLAVICLKAMEKNASRRFQKMEEFAADLQRYLMGEVIHARPAGFGIRVVKRIRRHPLVATAVAAIMVALVAIAFNAAWSYSRVLEERNKAAAVNAFMAEVFKAPDPDVEGKDLKVVDFLAKASEKAASAYEGQPEVMAALHTAIGDTYVGLGDYEYAVKEYETALGILNRNEDDDHPDFLELEYKVAGALVGLGQFPEAQVILRRVLDAREEDPGEEDPRTISTMQILAQAHWKEGDFATAEKIYNRAIAILERGRTRDELVRISVLHDKVCMRIKQKRYEDAEKLLAEALSGLRRMLKDDNTRTLQVMVNMAVLYMRLGRLDKAEELYNEALEIQTRILPEDHPDRFQTMNNLAALKCDRKDHEAAIELYREVLRFRILKWEESHPKTLNAMSNLAWTLFQADVLKEAEGLYEWMREIMSRHPERQYVSKHHWINNNARLLKSQGRFQEMVPLCREVLDERIRLFGERDPMTLDAGAQMANVLWRSGNIKEAERTATKWLEFAREVLPPENLTRIQLHSTYGLCLRDQGRYDEAAMQLKFCYEGAVAGGNHEEAKEYLIGLKIMYEKAGHPEKARALEAQASEIDGVKNR